MHALDWRQPPPPQLGGRWDLVLAADCVFWEGLFEPLLETILGKSHTSLTQVSHKSHTRLTQVSHKSHRPFPYATHKCISHMPRSRACILMSSSQTDSAAARRRRRGGRRRRERLCVACGDTPAAEARRLFNARRTKVPIARDRKAHAALGAARARGY